MPDEDRTTLEWLRTISGQLSSMHDDVKGKADKEDVEKDLDRVRERLDNSDEKINKVNNKINWASGVGTALLSALGLGDLVK